MATLEQQLKEIDGERDKKFIATANKNLIANWAADHFGPEYKVVKTRHINEIRKDVIAEIDKRLGNDTKEEKKQPKLSPDLERKKILFQKFGEETVKTLPPFEDVFTDSGVPKYVLCVSNNTVWEPSPGMLKSLGKEFEPCDKDGVIRRIEDYGKRQ